MGATAPSQSVPSTGVAVYRHREPTATALYPIVQHHLESFLVRADSRGDPVPRWAEDDFRAYLRCGILAHGFARARCGDCGAEAVPSAHSPNCAGGRGARRRRTGCWRGRRQLASCLERNGAPIEEILG